MFRTQLGMSPSDLVWFECTEQVAGQDELQRCLPAKIIQQIGSKFQKATQVLCAERGSQTLSGGKSMLFHGKLLVCRGNQPEITCVQPDIQLRHIRKQKNVVSPWSWCLSYLENIPDINYFELLRVRSEGEKCHLGKKGVNPSIFGPQKSAIIKPSGGI